MRVEIIIGALVTTLVMTTGALRVPDAAQQTGGPDERIVRARAILSTEKSLTSGDVAVVQAAVRAALAGKYAVQRIVSGGLNGDLQPPPEVVANREDEYLLDDRARVRFHRYVLPDTARPGRQVGNIMEFTDTPAVKCSDRAPYPGRRLGVSYVEDRNGWRVTNVVVVGEGDGPWEYGHPANPLLRLPAEGFSDAGTRTVQGRRTRGIRHAQKSSEQIVWLDPQSLLPLMSTLVITVDGERAEVSSEWRYPPPRALARPVGVTPPDCI